MPVFLILTLSARLYQYETNKIDYAHCTDIDYYQSKDPLESQVLLEYIIKRRIKACRKTIHSYWNIEMLLHTATNSELIVNNTWRICVLNRENTSFCSLHLLFSCPNKHFISKPIPFLFQSIETVIYSDRNWWAAKQSSSYEYWKRWIN